MILLNFSHPLTAEHLAQIESLVGRSVAQVIDASVQIDQRRPLADQVSEIVDRVGLSPQEWQTQLLLVNLPGYAPAAAALLAELHGRMGYFPPIVWVTPVAASTPPSFQVAQVINLQALRDAARTHR
ncbi:MAG: hypothetical protein JW934_13270 [Anaerolineae bacterium]|nr:hypothetical protein [Anaerolineae bacterium]